MLSPDVELVDLDGAHFAGWLDLLLPPGITGGASFAVVFVDGPQVLKAVASGRGALPAGDVPFRGTAHAELDRLRRALEVAALVVLERDALPRLLGEVERRLRPEDDLAAQGVTFWRALKDQLGAGVWVEPRVLELVPAVSFDALQRTFDLLVPDRSSMLAYVFSRDRRAAAASIIAVKDRGDVVLATTHLGIEDRVAEADLARDWRGRYPGVLDAVADRYAPASIGLFLDRAAYRRILTGTADQLGRELAAKNVIIDPMPAWLAGLLGGAAAAVGVANLARSLGRFVPAPARRAAAGIAAAAEERLRESGMHPFSLLGFDPIAVWNELRRYF